MFRKFLLLTITIFSISQSDAQSVYPSYYFQNDMEFSTPGTMLFGLSGFNNPAELSFQPQPNIYFTWNDLDSDFNDLNNWGLFTSVPYFGFSMHNQKYKRFSVIDYKISTAFGSDAFSAGVGYGWSSGDVGLFNRSDIFTLGSIYRPTNFLTFSLMANLPTRGEIEGIIGAGLRPLGNYNLTLFGDYTFTEDKIPEKIKWSAGASIEPIDGLRIIGRYFEGKSFNVGLQLGLGMFGLTTIAHYNEDSKRSYNTYGIRIGAHDRNSLRIFSGNDNYVSMSLQGGIKYQNFKLFDNSKTLFNLLEQLEAVKNDNSVSGIAINLSGSNINKEMFWELREKLQRNKII